MTALARLAGWVGAVGLAVPLVDMATLQTPRAMPAPVAFEDVAGQAGLVFQPINGASPDKYLVETMGSGGLFFDYDQDGAPDVFLVDGGSFADRALAARARHRLFHNRGDGTFEDVSARSGIRHEAYGMGACAADYDNDGLVDLYVTGAGANSLYHNDGSGRFRDVTRTAGVAASQWSTSCAFADFDNDGFVDLFVTRYLDAGMGNNKYLRRSRQEASCLLPSAELPRPLQPPVPQQRRRHLHRRHRPGGHRAVQRQRTRGRRRRL